MPGKRDSGGSYNLSHKHRGGRGSGNANPTITQTSHSAVMSDSFDSHEMNPQVPERFGRGKYFHDRQSHDSQPSNHLLRFDVSLNVDIRKYIEKEENLRSTCDKDTWVESSEMPETSEMHLTSGDVQLPPNKIKKPFKSVQQYLKTHYSLLREDAVSPLREAIERCRQNPAQKDDNNLSVYEKVYVTGFTFTNMGIAVRLRFSTIRAERRILWSSSKRLVSGTLIALTPADDCFGSKCSLAVVAARPLELLEETPPEIDVYFSCPEDIPIDPQTQFIMVEARQGYYEAYRHTLKAFQKLSSESFDLSEHVIGTTTDVAPPQYLATSPLRSLVPALQLDSTTSSNFQSVNIVDEWPDLPADSTLDKSQWSALEQILTKKLAIVQGPPGTGKTHVSKVALEIMIRNRGEADPPIVIAAQTNHALDQLLGHVSLFDPNYIRLGGRSTNAKVRQRALYEVRQKERFPKVPGSLFGPAKKKLEKLQIDLKNILMIFHEDPETETGSKTISDKILFECGIINDAQRKSLMNAAKDWVSPEGDSHDPVQFWLGDALTPFEVHYGDDTFGFQDLEDEDLEFEQLRETEAEHGVTDEEDIEVLRGPWKAVCDDWTVARPSVHDESKAKHLLDTKQDLWHIHERMRGAVYWVMKQRAKESTLTKFIQIAREYNKVTRDLKIGRWERDAVYLRRANVIGMTTTGLSKYRPLIASLKPKIVLVEEAAEVIEAPVAAACMESVEHLILVGDHKQLQGHCSVQELEEPPYNLAVSMFERLVNLKMPFKSLSCQRRMIPEVRQLIASLYPQLQDHESVLTRDTPPAWGTGSLRSFFFNHGWSELKDVAMSTYNEPEARMVAKFYRHLIRHFVPPSKITILTFYNAQRRMILKELKSDPETNFAYNIVKTVDSYQGEENAIVILSLVRSNSEGNVGFLNVDNRVCVALSRAREGFYIFGNSDLVTAKSALWFTVQRIMEGAEPSRFGPALPLTCFQHNQTIHVRWPEDFDKAEGGCGQWCGSELPCGHMCPKRCHTSIHADIECGEKCDKLLTCGHVCSKKCYEICRCCNQDCPNNNHDGSEPQVNDHVPMVHQPLPLSDGFNNLSTSVAPSGGNRRERGHPPVKQQSRIVPSGHATGQPLRLSDFPSLQETFRQPSQPNTSVFQATGQVQSFSNWNSFAEGGVRTDNETREELRRADEGRYVDDLLDLSPIENKKDPVKATAEEKMDGHRIKYTQTYQPAVPTGSSFGRNMRRIEDTTSRGANGGSVPNLMD